MPGQLTHERRQLSVLRTLGRRDRCQQPKQQYFSGGFLDIPVSVRGNNGCVCSSLLMTVQIAAP